MSALQAQPWVSWSFCSPHRAIAHPLRHLPLLPPPLARASPSLRPLLRPPAWTSLDFPLQPALRGR